jgi:putative PIG3 family NAD(P)H quinone oxidoreductase
MRFIDYRDPGKPEDLFFAEASLPALADHKVRVKVTAFGINRADTLQRQGKYPAPKGESLILGLEVAGEVIEQGSDVQQSLLGKQMFGLVAGGGYSEYVDVDPSHLMPVPEGLLVKQAAGIAEVFLTAYQSLFLLANLQAENKVLIHAGASGVGLAATQLAKHSGCQIAVTASSQQKLNTCRQNGADVGIHYPSEDFSEKIKDTLGGVDTIIDFIGGDYLNRNLKVLNQDGTIVYLAMLAGRYADKLDIGLMLAKRASIKGSTLRNRSDAYKTDLIKRFSNDCLGLFESGELTVNIDSFIDAKDISKAHQRLENNDSKGKLIGVW